jgi:prepilin-type N-terminal cleavage/methylation domain-containing protein
VRGERGFTLLEVTLALLIASLLLTLAIPRLPRLGRTELEAAADRLASTMTYIADEAALRGRLYKLTLDLDAERWTVSALAVFAGTTAEASRPEFREDPDDPLARAIQLPPGIFLDSVVDRDGESRSGARALFFLPEGLTENVSVRLTNEDDASVLVTLDAARGLAMRGETVEGLR